MLATNETVHEVSSMVERLLKDVGWTPNNVCENEENVMFFIWNDINKYADIECLPTGEVLWGLTDFKNISEVGNLNLNISSIMNLKERYDSL